jgi:hypothetical protein
MTGEEKKAAVLEILGDIVGPDVESAGIIQFDGLEDAIIGVARQQYKDPLIVYDERAIIDHFMDAEEMTEEEAWDWYGFNVQCLWAGEGTPLILRRVDEA